MYDVKDEKPMVVAFLAVKPNAWPPKVRIRVKDLRSVNAPASSTSLSDVAGIDHTILLSGTKIHVFDVARSRVVRCVEVESISEELGAGNGTLEGVGLCAHNGDEACQSDEGVHGADFLYRLRLYTVQSEKRKYVQ